MAATASSNHAPRHSESDRRAARQSARPSNRSSDRPPTRQPAHTAAHKAKVAVQPKSFHLPLPPALIVVLGLVLVFVSAGFILYPVAQDFYHAFRENGRADAEHQAVVDRNATIQEQIDNIQTPEGIEDRAREQFGWVRPGEEAVNITGLEITKSSTVLPEAVAPGSIMPYEDWWTQSLDSFFGYDYQAPEPLSPEYEPIPGL